MRSWIWVGILALVVALVAIPWATAALAQGPMGPGPHGGSWEDMESYCHGPGGMMGGEGMGGSYTGLADPVTLKRVADTLKLTYQQLTERQAKGETIAQVAQAQGIDTSQVIATILAPQKEILQVRVKYGYLSEALAQSLLEQARIQAEGAITVPTYAFYAPSGSPISGYTPGYGGGFWGGPRGMMGGGTMGGGMMGGGMIGGGERGGGMMGR